MAFGPQRRHVVASAGSIVHALTLQQHLMTPNILVLVGRIFTQIQISSSSILHPDKSLTALSFLVVAVNVLGGFFHYIAFAANVQTTEGLLIDFVGQVRPASMMQVLVIDASISGLQLLCLTVSYLSSRPHSRSASLFSYPDPLLPPVDFTSSHASNTRLRHTEEGYAQKLLNDDDYTTDETDASSSPTGHAPVILNLSLSHLCRLVLFYPSPAPPERSTTPTLTRAHPTVSNDARQAPSQGERLPGQWISQAS